MSLRKKNPEHANHERWLVSYADFITLLFAFFVVMYALSMENLAKVKAAAESIRKAFGGAPTMTNGGPGAGRGGGGRSVSPFQDSELDALKGQLNEQGLETGEADLSDHMQALMDDRGLVVRLSAKDFFGRYEIAVRPDFQPLLDRVGRVIAHSGRSIRVEGYTDATEAANIPGFPTDWELSAARGAWVARYLIARFRLDPAHVGVAGYAHYRGLEAQSHEPQSDWATSKNRRIEIVILK